MGKANTLKWSNNGMSEEELKCLIALLSKEGKDAGKVDSVSTVFFEWNPLGSFAAPLPQSLLASLLRPCFSSLILRSNSLGDALTKELLARIPADSKLRYLDLYDNSITGDSVPAICKLLEENKSIEYLGLSKNRISEAGDLEQLFAAIGNVRLSPEELANYRKLEKERDDILEKNKKKKKGQPDEPVPFLLKIQEIDSEWYYVKNQKVKGMTLGWNGIRSGDVVRAFVQRVNAEKEAAAQFEIVLTGNEFAGGVLETLREMPGVRL